MSGHSHPSLSTNTFKTMIQELNANTLAQIAIDQIEENDIVNILSDQYEAAETALNILKQKKKASEETLAALMPNSKCIHRTPVMQVV